MPRIESFFPGSTFVPPDFVLKRVPGHWPDLALCGQDCRQIVKGLTEASELVVFDPTEGPVSASVEARLVRGQSSIDGNWMPTLESALLSYPGDPNASWSSVYFVYPTGLSSSSTPPEGFAHYVSPHLSGTRVGPREGGPLVTTHAVWRDKDIDAQHCLHLKLHVPFTPEIVAALYAAVLNLARPEWPLL